MCCVRACAVPVEKAPPAAPVRWFEPGEAGTNDTEDLMIALALNFKSFGSVRELEAWSSKVLKDEKGALDALKQASQNKKAAVSVALRVARHIITPSQQHTT